MKYIVYMKYNVIFPYVGLMFLSFYFKLKLGLVENKLENRCSKAQSWKTPLQKINRWGNQGIVHQCFFLFYGKVGYQGPLFRQREEITGL